MPQSITFSVPAPSDQVWRSRDAAELTASVIPVGVGDQRILADVDRAEIIDDGLELRLTVTLPDGFPVTFVEAPVGASFG